MSELYLIECIEHRYSLMRKKEKPPRLWWAPNKNGYTWDIRRAGRYTKDEAMSICRSLGSTRDDRAWSEADVLTGKAGEVYTYYGWDKDKPIVGVRL